MIKTNIIHNANCMTGLLKLPDESIDCCVTSPPYWGLRDYGTGTWEGGDPECDHARKTSKKVGASTLESPSTNSNHEREGWKGGVCGMCGAIRVDNQLGLESSPELFVSNLCDVLDQVRRVLSRVGTLWLNLGDSYASQAGDYNSAGSRGATASVSKDTQASVVKKRSKIPDGIKAKDLIGIPWMVAFELRRRGWYLRQDIVWEKPNAMPESVTDRCTKSHEYIFLLSKSSKYYYDAEAIKTDAKADWGTRDRTNGKYSNEGTGLTPHSGLEKEYKRANKRSVWSVSTASFDGAHFATFPEDLIVDCIKAGCPEGGIVLDPFMGGGTTGLVARKLNRNYIGFELNPEYIAMAEKRIRDSIGLFY